MFEASISRRDRMSMSSTQLPKPARKRLPTALAKCSLLSSQARSECSILQTPTEQESFCSPVQVPSTVNNHPTCPTLPRAIRERQTPWTQPASTEKVNGLRNSCVLSGKELGNSNAKSHVAGLSVAP